MLDWYQECRVHSQQGRIPLPSESMMSVGHSGRMAEVPLVNLSQPDSGKYACKYCQTEGPRQCSPATDVLLVVPGGKEASQKDLV